MGGAPPPGGRRASGGLEGGQPLEIRYMRFGGAGGDAQCASAVTLRTAAEPHRPRDPGAASRNPVGQTANIEVLLVHSPLVGPMTLAPLAEELRRHGWSVALPDLRDALRAPSPQWRAIVDLATAGQRQPDIIVGHSGAGVLLPVLTEALDPTFVAYVDAVVPDGDTHTPSTEFVEFIDSLETDGSMLPPWHLWWGHDVMTQLVPDADLRAQIAAETPRVPRSFYDDAVQLPGGWSRRAGCVMLQLSAGYEQFRSRAETLGWPTDAVDGQHLDVATRPALVRERVLRLLEHGRVSPQPD